MDDKNTAYLTALAGLGAQPNPVTRDEALLNAIADRLDAIEEGGGGSSSLEGLSDVDIQSAGNGEVLRYDSSAGKWENTSPPWAEMTEVSTSNIFNPADTSPGAFLPWDGSILDYPDTFHSYIPCEPGVYTFLSPSWLYTGNTGRTPLFDADKEYVNELTGTVTEYDENNSIVTLTIPESASGVSYFGFSQSSSLLSTLMVVKGSSYPTGYIPYGTIRTIEGLQILQSQIIDLNIEGNPLKGKIASFNGDSIAAGAGFSGGYASIIGNENGMVIENISISGATITPTQGIAHIISTSIVDMRADADYVILEGGVNDADLQVTLGTITGGYTSTLDTTTFSGAFEDMLKSALSRFPGKKIGYIFVHKASASFDSRTTNSYYNVAKEACEKWGIPYLDLNTEAPPLGYIDSLKSAYTSNADGYHPNEAGYRAYYVPKITAWMKTL